MVASRGFQRGSRVLSKRRTPPRGLGQLIKTGGGSTTIGTGAGGIGKIVQTGGNFSSGGNEVLLGENGTGDGTWDMSGGTATVAVLNLGIADAAKGTLLLGGNAVLNAGTIRVGWGTNVGAATQSIVTVVTGGTLNITSGADVLQLGDNRGTGLLTMSGGTVNLTNAGSVMNLGWGGTSAGTVQHNSGSINLANNLVVNRDSSSAQVYNMAGGNLNASNVILGRGIAGSATFTQTNGTVALSGNLDVQENNAGTFSLSGGTLSVDGNIDAATGTFTFTGGRITRSNAGIITYLGNLISGNSAAGFDLDADKTFSISGAFDITAGVSFDINGRTIPAYDGSGIDTGSFTLGTDGSVVSSFSVLNTLISGLSNLAGATFISEADGEAVAFNPSTDSVYWVQENAGTVSLQYSVVLEPGSLGLLACTMLGGAFLRRRRR